MPHQPGSAVGAAAANRTARAINCVEIIWRCGIQSGLGPEEQPLSSSRAGNAVLMCSPPSPPRPIPPSVVAVISGSWLFWVDRQGLPGKAQAHLPGA